jgi:hypothetical protein
MQNKSENGRRGGRRRQPKASQCHSIQSGLSGAPAIWKIRTKAIRLPENTTMQGSTLQRRTPTLGRSDQVRPVRPSPTQSNLCGSDRSDQSNRVQPDQTEGGSRASGLEGVARGGTKAIFGRKFNRGRFVWAKADRLPIPSKSRALPTCSMKIYMGKGREIIKITWFYAIKTVGEGFIQGRSAEFIRVSRSDRSLWNKFRAPNYETAASADSLTLKTSLICSGVLIFGDFSRTRQASRFSNYESHEIEFKL